METIFCIIWIIAFMAIILFFHYILIPFVEVKYILWNSSRIIKKIAKKCEDKETKKELEYLSELLIQINKNEKL